MAKRGSKEMGAGGDDSPQPFRPGLPGQPVPASRRKKGAAALKKSRKRKKLSNSGFEAEHGFSTRA